MLHSHSHLTLTGSFPSIESIHCFLSSLFIAWTTYRLVNPSALYTAKQETAHTVTTSHLTPSLPLTSHCHYLSPHTVTTSHLTPPLPLTSHCHYLSPHTITTSHLTTTTSHLTPSLPLTSHRHYLSPHSHYLSPHTVTTSHLTPSLPLTSHHHYFSVHTLTHTSLIDILVCDNFQLHTKPSICFVMSAPHALLHISKVTLKNTAKV